MRCAVVTDDRLDALLLDRVLSEYREMPGLALTLDELPEQLAERHLAHAREGIGEDQFVRMREARDRTSP